MPHAEPISNRSEYYVYILRCRGDRLYTGVTTNPKRRFSEHAGSERGAKFTHAFPPEGVAALWKTDTRAQAQRMEARIKKLSRAQKESLIETDDRSVFSDSLGRDAFLRITGV